MKTSLPYKKIIVEVVCYLYIVLFVYAALSKLMEFDSFSIQLGQSPLIGAFAPTVRWLVPLLELIIALGLCVKATRLVSLFMSFILMSCFTAYIYIILNFSSYVPCSCGGILENLSWSQHLAFNIVFVLLSVIALTITLAENTHPKVKKYTKIGPVLLVLSFTFIISAAAIWLLFSVSEQRLAIENPFQRKFIPGTAREGQVIDLNYNTYYFAGLTADTIYLGNAKAFQRVTKIDTALTIIEPFDIQFPFTTNKYLSLRLSVVIPFFYYSDGTVPEILRGSTNDWKLSDTWKAPGYFNKIAILDSITSIVRNIDMQKELSYLSRHDLREERKKDSYSLLTKQVDGIYDCEGDMHAVAELKAFVYVYRYRNAYFMTDRNLTLLRKNTTIDTNSIAKIEVATARETGYTQLASPPVVVNKSSTVSSNLLFVHSVNRGKFESAEIRNFASTIDVYDMVRNTYLASFYIYHYKGKKLRAFAVKGNALYALVGNALVKYTIGTNITSQYVK